jgi:hypothetical protein
MSNTKNAMLLDEQDFDKLNNQLKNANACIDKINNIIGYDDIAEDDKIIKIKNLIIKHYNYADKRN